MSPKVFVAVLIVLMVCASITYAIAGDYRRALYWAFAVGLNVVVTW